MPSNRIFVNFIPKSGGISKWNPLLSPIESIIWRRKNLPYSTEETPGLAQKRNLSFLYLPDNLISLLFRRKLLQIPSGEVVENKRNLSFLFNIDPTPPVVDDLSWRHKFFYNDYLSSILNFKQNKKINAVVLVPIIPPNLDYYRRYLNDPETVGSNGPAVSLPVGTETSLTNYMRRYLNDPTS